MCSAWLLTEAEGLELSSTDWHQNARFYVGRNVRLHDFRVAQDSKHSISQSNAPTHTKTKSDVPQPASMAKHIQTRGHDNIG